MRAVFSSLAKNASLTGVALAASLETEAGQVERRDVRACDDRDLAGGIDSEPAGRSAGSRVRRHQEVLDVVSRPEACGQSCDHGAGCDCSALVISTRHR